MHYLRLFPLLLLCSSYAHLLLATITTQDLVTEQITEQRSTKRKRPNTNVTEKMEQRSTKSTSADFFKKIAQETLDKNNNFITETITVSAYDPNDLFTRSISLQAPTLLATKERPRKERDLLHKELRKVTRHKSVKQMSEDDLRTAATVSEQLQEYDESLTYLKQLVKVTKSSTVVQKATLEIADVTFQNGNLKGAAELYSKYALTYPGDKQKAAYAEYLSLLAHNSLRCTNDRDQTATLKTISLADAFLERQNNFSKQYQEDVLAIKNDCFNQLYNHSVVVFDFYTKQKHFKAAEARLTSIKTQFLAMRPDLTPNIMECDIRLAEARKDTLRVAELTQDLQSRFPHYLERRIVAEATPRRAYVNRF